MTKKGKVILIYLITILIIFLTVTIFNDKSLLEIIMDELGIYSYSKGDTGLYYPTVFGLTIIFFNRFWLKKLSYTKKLHNNYLYHCFGIVFFIAIFKRILSGII
ncbi:MAG: hypothetical protein FH751_14165 [Firmicutes bacterium]|nr:hypothetical protein [Bacillota bacterium]